MPTSSRFAALTFLLLATSLPGTLPAVEIIGHRGASHDAPENTLASFKLAWAQGTDAIELDLWLSTDGKLIVFHDGDTKRIGKTNQKISALSWADVQALDVGEWKGPEFKGERIPTLEAVLATIPAGKRAVLELKCGPEIVPEFARVVKASGQPAKAMCVISFNEKALAASKQALPELDHYFLAAFKKDAKTGAAPVLAPLVAKAKANHFDGLDLNFDAPISKEFMTETKAAGLKLFTWTVDDPAVAKQQAEAGADGVTTNRPGWLREQLQAK